MSLTAKLIIYIICLFTQLNMYPVSPVTITGMLIAFIVLCIPDILINHTSSTKLVRNNAMILWFLFLISAIAIPQFRLFAPLAIIDIVTYKLIPDGFLSIILLILLTTSSAITGAFMFLIALVSAMLSYLIKINTSLQVSIRNLKDTSREFEIITEQNNRTLHDKQDSEIYMATLRERNRIAREIHDNVGHMITRSILQVGAIKTINTCDAANEPLESLHDTLNTAMSNIRSSVHDLHDDSIDLYAALNEILEPLDSLLVNFRYDCKSNIPKNIKYCFISITKEAVNNTLRHSNATTLDVTVQEHPAFYQLLICDNGTINNTHKSPNPNIARNSAVTDGIGLTNMKARVKNLNGYIKITDDNGFRILVSILKN